MIKYIPLVVLILFLFTNTIQSQSIDVIRQLHFIAEELFYDKNYNKALDVYLKLDSIINGKDPFYKMQIAVCYLNTNVNKAKAVDYLENINKAGKLFGEDYYYALGCAYHLAYRIDDAIQAYQKFLKLADINDTRIKDAQRRIEMCNNAKQILTDSIEVRIENLGEIINSVNADFSPLISAEESVLIFTSNREGSIGGLQDINNHPDTLYGEYYEDIFVSIKVQDKWKKPLNIGAIINSVTHDATCGLSPDGEQLFIYRSDKSQWGNILYCNTEGYEWTTPIEFPYPINSRFWESNISITPYGNTIYFSSNRKGGVGNRDIYSIKKLPNGKWAEPYNLGEAINTPYDDVSPFMHPDGKTLYFSSRGHNSIGGFDIFKTSFKDGKWATPINLKYPINTTDDDIDFVVSASGKRGYYASSKDGGYGNKDIYEVYLLNTEMSPEPIVLIKGFFSGCEDKIPEEIIMTVKDNESGEIIALIRPNIVTGKYLLILALNKSYNIKIQAKNYSDYIEDISTVGLSEYKEIDKNIKMECK